jgi:hypothetical protein
MSLLTPLYVLGLLAVSLPVLFHLIRRMPRGEFAFSSLMFLSPSPPRLTRRSRLEHLLLLLLRAGVLSLLAFAFARPFLRQQLPRDATTGDQRRTAIVVDTSASMRRGNLWQQALSHIDEAIADSGPFDQLAVFTCDVRLGPVVGFEQMSQIEASQRRGVVTSRLKQVRPSWAGTHLGQGLMDAVDLVNDLSESTTDRSRIERRVVLISDMQQGSRLNILADYPWPEDVRLELRSARLPRSNNAGLIHLADSSGVEGINSANEIRVRVSNDADSLGDQFRLGWVDETGRPGAGPVTAYVPPGESRVVRVTRPNNHRFAKLRLNGDSCDFDNSLYFADRTTAESTVLYLGSDRADDPQGLRYYLERAVTDALSHSVKLVAAAADKPLAIDSPAKTPLVVATAGANTAHTPELKEYVESGGTLLFVLADDGPKDALSSILNSPSLRIEEAKVDGYAMLSQIAFDHPLFASMAAPNFNDFTQIHFWKYRRLTGDDLKNANLIAKFENGDPAAAEWRLGKGRVLVLTSGWHPADSQLARSWKFVLLVASLVDADAIGKFARTNFVVNEPVTLGDDFRTTRAFAVTKPDGTKVTVASNQARFDDTDIPGLYSVESEGGVETFAVNLDPMESRTTPLEAETLEQFGCRLVGPNFVAENLERRQFMQDVQLERRQKFWQWLVLAALGMAVAETWLAGRATKRSLEGTSA